MGERLQVARKAVSVRRRCLDRQAVRCTLLRRVAARPGERVGARHVTVSEECVGRVCAALALHLKARYRPCQTDARQAVVRRPTRVCARRWQRQSALLAVVRCWLPCARSRCSGRRYSRTLAAPNAPAMTVVQSAETAAGLALAGAEVVELTRYLLFRVRPKQLTGLTTLPTASPTKRRG